MVSKVGSHNTAPQHSVIRNTDQKTDSHQPIATTLASNAHLIKSSPQLNSTRTLRVGILIESKQQPAWVVQMLHKVNKLDCIQLEVVVETNQPKTLSPQAGGLFKKQLNQALSSLSQKLYYSLIERHTYLPDALAQVDASDIFDNTSQLYFNAHDFSAHEMSQLDTSTPENQVNPTITFQKDDVENLAAFNLDVLIHLGSNQLSQELVRLPKHGVWSYQCGDIQTNLGGPPGLWESLQSTPTTSIVLRQFTDTMRDGLILAHTCGATRSLSITDNRSEAYWKALSMLPRQLQYLANNGIESFHHRIYQLNRHPQLYSKPLFQDPNGRQWAYWVFKKIVEKIKTFITNHCFNLQWGLAYHWSDSISTSLQDYKLIIPAKDRFWADPFVVHYEAKYFVFFEEMYFQETKGHIMVMTIDETTGPSEPQLVLKKPYHLSYPFILDHAGDKYLIPETCSQSRIEVYRCQKFPDQWEFYDYLMEGARFADATLHFYEGRWWLFANIIENEGASPWDELFLFHTDNLFDKQWVSHPMNPIVSDCKTARPAGKLFTHNGLLYRPSQKSTVRYGCGLNFCWIKTLTADDYEEELVSQANPDWITRQTGVHTLNREGRLNMIDFQILRARWSLPFRSQ